MHFSLHGITSSIKEYKKINDTKKIFLPYSINYSGPAGGGIDPTSTNGYFWYVDTSKKQTVRPGYEMKYNGIIIDWMKKKNGLSACHFAENGATSLNLGLIKKYLYPSPCSMLFHGVCNSPNFVFTTYQY